MRSSWAQPSLSRDFALLAAAIVFLLLLLSAWVAWVTYTTHSARIVSELEKEADRIDRTLEREIENAGYLLNAIGQQITQLDTKNLDEVARLLKTFDSHKPVYAVWSWTGSRREVVVSSNKGVLERPVSVADRDYVQKSQENPWAIHIGRPIQGRVSGKWVIPVGMGISDATGKYIGTLVASVDINALTEQISHLIKREGISFAIMSRTLVPLTVVSGNEHFIEEHFPPEMLRALNINEHPKGLLSKAPLFTGGGIYSYFQVSSRYPYVILVGYDTGHSDVMIRNQLWPRLIQITALASFLLLFLWIVRVRIIKPVVELTESAASVARGGAFTPLKNAGAQEIDALAGQIDRIADYILERKRVEEELRDKLTQAYEKR